MLLAKNQKKQTSTKNEKKYEFWLDSMIYSNIKWKIKI